MMSMSKSMSPVYVVVGRVLRLRRNTHWQQNASFDSLLSHAGLGHLKEGWIVRDITTRRLPYWANGLFFVAPSLEDCLTGLSGSSNRAGTDGTSWEFFKLYLDMILLC